MLKSLHSPLYSPNHWKMYVSVDGINLPQCSQRKAAKLGRQLSM